MSFAWLKQAVNTTLNNTLNSALQSELAQPAGLHLDGQKAISTQQPVTRIHCTPDTELLIPLQQHRGEKPELLIKVGDHVLKGQHLASANHASSVPIHASTSGIISAIEKRPIPHPSGLDDLCIILAPDGKDEAVAAHNAASEYEYLSPIDDYQQCGAEVLRERIRAAGIVGLGGAVFPASIKLRVHRTIPIETLVINGGECEPYITCDDMLMRDKATEILAGVQIMLHILAADTAINTAANMDTPPANTPNINKLATNLHCLIGIEDNKPEAIAAMQHAVTQLQDRRIQVISIPTLYPAGGEKQLIKTLTGKEVPSKGRPADKGIICHNVATSRAIYRAVVLGEPLISRYVTVSGSGISQPCNLDVPIGTPISSLIAAAGGYNTKAKQLIMGGPMMGISLADDHIPVVKATNCILVNDKTPPIKPTLPCIRCGQCAEHCPVSLLPQQLYWYAQARDFEKAESYHLFDCIECGCCDYVCPSNIPLVDYYRFAKTEIRDQRQAKQKAELARERHDFHNERLERAKRERAERLAKHKKKAVVGDKKDAIQAALERAKAKKARMVQEKAEASTENTPQTRTTDTNNATQDKGAPESP